MKFRRALTSVALITGLTFATAGPALGVTPNIAGGTWNHGVNYVFPKSKNVWSNFIHNSRVHASSVTCGQNNRYSGRTSPGVWSKASYTCGMTQYAAAYYSFP